MVSHFFTQYGKKLSLKRLVRDLSSGILRAFLKLYWRCTSFGKRSNSLLVVFKLFLKKDLHNDSLQSKSVGSSCLILLDFGCTTGKGR
jgi:hypothetical protein